MSAAPSPPNGIFIAKHDPLLCETLKEALQARHLHVRGYQTDGKEALRALLHVRPDLAIVGAELPGLNGVDIVRSLHEQRLPTRCVMFARSRRLDYLSEALALGVKGYLYVNSGFAELFYCIQEVLAGREYVTPQTQQVVEELTAHLPPKPANTTDLAKLSLREREVLYSVSLCYTNEQISEKMFISSATVNNHRHNIMKKLELHGPNQLLPYALSVQHLLK